MNNNGTEKCDDGNLVNLDGCNSLCQNETCGDGVINNKGKEQCDYGAADNQKKLGCSPTCMKETCGDGIRNNNET